MKFENILEYDGENFNEIGKNYINTYQQVFEENLAINLDPEKLMYFFLSFFLSLCTHLVDAVQDVVLMQKQ